MIYDLLINFENMQPAMETDLHFLEDSSLPLKFKIHLSIIGNFLINVKSV